MSKIFKQLSAQITYNRFPLMVTTMSMTLLLVLKKLGEPVSGTFLTIPLEHVTKYLDLESPFLSC